MTIVSMRAATSWQARTCYAAAALFTLASGGTNFIYGISKGTDAASSTVWAAVSVGVSIIFALSWPAFILSLDRKQWARAAMVLVALVVTGTYSVVAALGSASGGRMNAVATELATTGTRQRAQAAYDQARAVLAQLAPSRPLAEVEVMLAVAKPTCRVTVLNGKRDTFCTPNASLVAEKARAQRRVELQTQMDRANAALSEAPAHVANTDAKALQRYLGALEIRIDADRLNDLLTLLAVLVIECGGGMALAVGMALSEKPLCEQPVHTALIALPRTPSQKRRQHRRNGPVCTLCVAPRKRPEIACSPWWAMLRGYCALVTEPLAKLLASVPREPASRLETWRQTVRSVYALGRQDRSSRWCRSWSEPVERVLGNRSVRSARAIFRRVRASLQCTTKGLTC
jgi:hypothetical protein